MSDSHVIVTGMTRAAQLVLADITHIAVGTGTTHPTTGDTVLATETDRVVQDSSIQQGRTFQSRAFFTNAELPTTMEEAGWFMNGTASVDTGDLLVRSLLNFVKGSDDLTLVLIIKLVGVPE
jgi:hypothetical protein